MSLTWKDETGYSQTHPRSTTTPRIWVATVGDFKLVVTRDRYYPTNRWVGYVQPLERVPCLLEARELEAAKTELLLRFTGTIAATLEALRTGSGT